SSKPTKTAKFVITHYKTSYYDKNTVSQPSNTPSSYSRATRQTRNSTTSIEPVNTKLKKNKISFKIVVLPEFISQTACVAR
ncbi:MAG: hypothetical protein KAJ52_09285, partial [Sedimentisphaerales bacterium]|nr:hypothetical protein [Sedimentisphaerales bacterium]